MTAEALLVAGYAASLILGAFVLEWLSAHTHRRSLRYRSAGFTYHEHLDVWECPERQHLWPHELDPELRLVRYRAKAHVCNGCARKPDCTDSDRGREIVRPLDPWPHSEAGRFHRGISLVLIALAALIVLVEGVRNHAPGEGVLLLGVMGLAIAAGGRLVRDFVAHPANFPGPTPSHGMRMGTAVRAGAGSATEPRGGA